MTGCLTYVLRTLLKLAIFFYFYLTNGHLTRRIPFIYNLMNTGIFWSVLLTKIRGVTKIHIYFFKAWSMRTFVNVHTGVASGTSLIYMYDASKQNAKKKIAVWNLQHQISKRFFHCLVLCRVVIRQISVMVSLSSGKLIKVLKTTRQYLIRI